MENRRPGNLISAIVVFFLLLFAYTKLLGPIQFSVNNLNTTKTDSFQVQGSGKAADAPDKAVLTLGITNDAASVSDAQEKTNQIAQNIITALKNLGISDKDIKTVNYSIIPNFDFTTSRKTGTYTVSENIEVKVPIVKTNEVIDASTQNGANLIGGVGFILDDQKKKDLENKARQEAVKNAKSKADGLAKAAGIKLGRIINVSEDSGITPQPLFLDAKAQETPQTPTNLSPGQTTINLTVTLTYETF